MKACEHKWVLMSPLMGFSWCQTCGAHKAESAIGEKIRIPEHALSCDGCLTEHTERWEECGQCCRNDALIDNYKRNPNDLAVS